MKDLGKATKLELEEFLNSFDHIFSDIDGVLWHTSGHIPFPNVINFINSLKNVGKTFRFVTNNAMICRNVLISNVMKTGINNLTSEDIISPHILIINHLNSINYDKSKEIFVLGTNKLKDNLAEAGFKIYYEPAVIEVEENIGNVLNLINPNDNIGAVILDFDFNLTFFKMQKIVYYLKNKNVICLAGGSDIHIPCGSRDFSFIGGCYIQKAILECCYRVDDIIHLAKPTKYLRDYLIKHYNIADPKRALFIGDSITHDMGFGSVCNFQKLLVLSGTAKRDDLNNWKWPEDYKPDYYVEDLGKLYKVLKDNELI